MGIVFGGVAVLLAVGITLQWAPIKVPGYATQSPALRVLAGNFLGHSDDVVNEILSYSQTGKLHYLWKTGEPFEGSVNFWLLQDRANTLMPSGHEFRLYAYGINDQDPVTAMCKLATLNGGSLIVNTQDTSIASKLAIACPQSDIVVVH